VSGIGENPTPYEAPSVEEIDSDGAPISTAPGASLPIGT
jgi:hypothetical protein